MSQVSLPSQIGATENIIRSRQFSLCAALNRMPMPRSKPSTTTYMVIATPRIAAQRSGSQRPSRRIPFRSRTCGSSLFGGLRPGCFVSWAAFQTFVGQRKGPLRLLGRVLGAGDVIDRVGPFTQDLGQVVAAEPEHDHVDAEKRDE